MDFISEYWCACVKTMRAHPVLVICSRIFQCVMKVGWYNVYRVLCLNQKEFELVGARWVGEVWGWLIHAAYTCCVCVCYGDANGLMLTLTMVGR